MENVSHKGVTDDWASIPKRTWKRLLYQMADRIRWKSEMRLTTGISMRLMGRHPRDLCRVIDPTFRGLCNAGIR
ncbi:hypothetical protein [Mediterraneibacter gnavus]|uniref:hypothetical protein n=1 Tax=Mediterraneibacter gnavus TaxID=33038 RepID=UPI0013B04C40|nr:hypothetical protein [Mediterraneibacter gnavus]